jgi:hypothetical protein
LSFLCLFDWFLASVEDYLPPLEFIVQLDLGFSKAAIIR